MEMSSATAGDAADGARLIVLSKLAVFVAVVRRSGPHIIEASLIPTALFYCCITLAGLGTAYAVSLAWLYGALLWRIVRHKAIPPLLVLGVIGATVRTAVAVGSGSSFPYFAQPVGSSLIMGFVFLISILVGKPLVERLALEFWPLTPEMLERPAVNRLLRGLTFLWAGVNIAIGTTNLVLLLWVSIPTYVAMKQVASLGITGIGVAITIDCSVRTARREGFAQRPVKASASAKAATAPVTTPA